MPANGVRQLLDENFNPLSPLRSYLRQCKTARYGGHDYPSRIAAKPHVVGFDTKKLGPKNGGEAGPKRKIDGFFPPVKRMSKSVPRRNGRTEQNPTSISKGYRLSDKVELCADDTLTERYRTGTTYMTPLEDFYRSPDKTKTTLSLNARSLGMDVHQQYPNLDRGPPNHNNYTRDGIFSFLPRANSLEPHSVPFHVRRQKIKSGQTFLSKILNNDMNTTTITGHHIILRAADKVPTEVSFSLSENDLPQISKSTMDAGSMLDQDSA